MLRPKFQNIIMCAADSAAELRACDVFRVVNEANEQGCMLEFVLPLVASRPDLRKEIEAAMTEISAA